MPIKDLTLYKDKLSKELEQFDFEIYSFSKRNTVEQQHLYNEISPYYRFVVVTSGKGYFKSENVKYSLGEGDVAIISPYCVYDTVWENTSDSFVSYSLLFDVTDEKKRSNFKDLFVQDNINVYTSIIPTNVVSIIETYYTQSVSKVEGGNFSIKLLLLHILLAIQLKFPQNNTSSQKNHNYSANESELVSKCVDYIKKNVHKNIKVSDICEYANVSQSYLYRCFQKTFNRSIKKFIDMYKFRKIEIDLAQTSMGIQEIAEKYNFSSLYAFSNAFKAAYGVSPVNYRHNCLIGNRESIDDLDNF